MVDTVAPWLASMRADLGVEEIPGSAVNPRIIAKARLPGVKFPQVEGLVAYGLLYQSDDTQAWCGAEAGGCFAEVGIMPPFNKAVDTESYFWAASWRPWGVPCAIRVGAVVCFDGHVALVNRIIDGNTIEVIGGNQGSPKGGAVTLSPRQVSSVRATRWPDAAALAAAGLSQFSLSAAPGDSATTTIRPQVQLGSTGGFVTELQKILEVTATGIFDAATDTAVRAFQAKHGLDVDGEVGPNTWGALLGGSITIAGDVPHAAEYADDWQRMTILPEHLNEIEHYAAAVALPNKARYQAAVAGTKAPWFFVAVVHMRESGGNFSRNIHNGQPLGQVTTIEPLNRGPFDSFEASVADWIKLKGLDKIVAWVIERFAYQSELNNGMGYRNRGVPSAYLWSFSNIYRGGKYISDHVWSATAMDSQCGTMPLLKEMMALDSSIVFAAPSPVGTKPPIEGEVLDPIAPGETPAAPAIGNLMLIVGGLFFLMKFLEKPQMTTGQGLDLSKILAELQKIGAVLQDPAVQKLISNKPMTPQEMFSVLPAVLQLLPSHALALPAPAMPVAEPEAPAPSAPASVATPAPVKVEPAPIAPPTTPPVSPLWANLGTAGTLLSGIAGLWAGGAMPDTTALVSSAAAAALSFTSIPAPVINGVLSLFKGLKITRKAA